MGLMQRLRSGFSGLMAGPSEGSWATTDDRWFTPVTELGRHLNSPQAALQIAAVYACVKILAETIGTLPLHLYRRTGPNTVEKATEHPLYRILHTQPNPFQTSTDARMWAMAVLALRGVFYMRKIFDSRGRLIRLIPLNSDAVSIVVDKAGDITYRLSSGGLTETLTLNDIFRVQSFTLDPLEPLGVVGLARQTFNQARSISTFGTRMFENDARPGGVLSYPGRLGPEGKANLLSAWNVMHAGPTNARKTALLEEGVKFEAITMTAEDAQFVAAQEATIPEICRWFRIPPHMVADLSRSTFSNIESQVLDFVKYTIQPWIVMWEQSIERDLLNTPSLEGYFVKFSLQSLLRADSEGRAKYYSAALMGWMTPNEVRSYEEMEPVEDGDQIRVPMNSAPLGSDAAEGIEEAPKRVEPSREPPRVEPPRPRRRAIDTRLQAFIGDAAWRIATKELRALERVARKNGRAEEIEAFFGGFEEERAVFRSQTLHIDIHLASRTCKVSCASYRALYERVGLGGLADFLVAHHASIVSAAAAEIVTSISKEGELDDDGRAAEGGDGENATTATDSGE